MSEKYVWGLKNVVIMRGPVLMIFVTMTLEVYNCSVLCSYSRENNEVPRRPVHGVLCIELVMLRPEVITAAGTCEKLPLIYFKRYVVMLSWS